MMLAYEEEIELAVLLARCIGSLCQVKTWPKGHIYLAIDLPLLGYQSHLSFLSFPFIFSFFFSLLV